GDGGWRRQRGFGTGIRREGGRRAHGTARTSFAFYRGGGEIGEVPRPPPRTARRNAESGGGASGGEPGVARDQPGAGRANPGPAGRGVARGASAVRTGTDERASRGADAIPRSPTGRLKWRAGRASGPGAGAGAGEPLQVRVPRQHVA